MLSNWLVRSAVALLALSAACAFHSSLASAAQPSQQPAPSYTAPEYNSYLAASQATPPPERIKQLDAFVQRYPQSALLPYVYASYYAAYFEVKDYPKTIEYADRLLALGDKFDVPARLQASATRTTAFLQSFRDSDAAKDAELTKAREIAAQGIVLLDKLPAPAGVTPENFTKEKVTAKAFYYSVIGYTYLELKDYAQAIPNLRTASETYTTDPVLFLRLGISYLKSAPPSYLDGFWSLARSAALKGPTEAQTRKYLLDQVLNYQQCGCQPLAEAEVNQWISAAAASPVRPATLDIPSAADLARIRDSAGPILEDLQKDDANAQKLWLAVCGLEFPEVAVKILSASNADNSYEFQAYRSPVMEEMEKATTPNMRIKVPAGEDGVSRLKAGDYVRFHGTLIGMQRDPFVLTWEKAAINPEDIPAEKTKSKKTGPKSGN